jgi:NACalpha-BTF3-like transcription factor
MLSHGLASLKTAYGEWHFHDVAALCTVMKFCGAGMGNTTEGDEGDVQPHDPHPKLLDGYTIQAWAAYGRRKAKVATEVCKENGRLKSLSTGAYDVQSYRERGLDPLLQHDPWIGNRVVSQPQQRLTQAKGTLSSVEAWARWTGPQCLPGHATGHIRHAEASPFTLRATNPRQQCSDTTVFREDKKQDRSAQALAQTASQFGGVSALVAAAAKGPATANIEEPEMEGAEVDETGIEAKEIQIVTAHAQCTRAAAVTALRANSNDIVDAIIAVETSAVATVVDTVESTGNKEQYIYKDNEKHDVDTELNHGGEHEWETDEESQVERDAPRCFLSLMDFDALMSASSQMRASTQSAIDTFWPVDQTTFSDREDEDEWAEAEARHFGAARAITH